MFKRFRQLQISLAAKCQLLFGAAVLLIIAAALWVPWQRMEQLTDQMNERTAKTLADWAEDDHVQRQRLARANVEWPAEWTENVSVDRGPTTRPGRPTTMPYGGIGKATVRMVLLSRSKNVEKFERKAI